ncbi:MAG: bifunctional chorismate mutase/prephenate dehydratase [Oscillospiraceae bacterium]
MELSEIRESIDQIDEELLTLFIKRMGLAHQVAEYKAANNMPILNKSREREILRRVSQESGEFEGYAHRLFSVLFELSRTYQAGLCAAKSNVRTAIEQALKSSPGLFPKNGTIACQGVEGAYSQMAADRMFPRGNIVFFKSFEGVFDAVENGMCDFGILPIENSSNGSVRNVYDLLQRKNVSIVRSERLCIRHELLAKPGVKLSEITEIHSHQQALGQCSQFLKSLGDSVKIIPCDNTAMAAQLVSQSPDRGIAAISSSGCAALYGLEPITGACLQNSDNNYTRFICISKTPAVYPGANRINLVISCDHKPGALYDILAQISALELNLIKLESCPMVGHDFEFLFFFEIEASVLEPKVVDMLENLEHTCRSLKYLGNYTEV